MAFNYFTYAAASSIVEIDCLTGDHQVLRTDIVMDLGSSLNPAIDIGNFILQNKFFSYYAQNKFSRFIMHCIFRSNRRWFHARLWIVHTRRDGLFADRHCFLTWTRYKFASQFCTFSTFDCCILTIFRSVQNPRICRYSRRIQRISSERCTKSKSCLFIQSSWRAATLLSIVNSVCHQRSYKSSQTR